jgi:hypothetical protein
VQAAAKLEAESNEPQRAVLLLGKAREKCSTARARRLSDADSRIADAVSRSG